MGTRLSEAPRVRGAASVEFALVMTAFLMLFLGCIEVGRAMWLRGLCLEVVSAAARMASISDLVTAGRTDATAIKDCMVSKIPGLTADKIILSSLPSGCVINPTSSADQTCEQMEVTISGFRFDSAVPLVPLSFKYPDFTRRVPKELTQPTAPVCQ